MGKTDDERPDLRLPPLRKYWQEINRHRRAEASEERRQQQARDKRRAKCKCAAYPWPHRPGGGLCQWPRPPAEQWIPRKQARPYAKRYLGLRRQIARSNCLHPIRDRVLIDAIMSQVIKLARELKAINPRIKYRNVLIERTGVLGLWQTAGLRM